MGKLLAAASRQSRPGGSNGLASLPSSCKTSPTDPASTPDFTAFNPAKEGFKLRNEPPEPQPEPQPESLQAVAAEGLLFTTNRDPGIRRTRRGRGFLYFHQPRHPARVPERIDLRKPARPPSGHGARRLWTEAVPVFFIASASAIATMSASTCARPAVGRSPRKTSAPGMRRSRRSRRCGNCRLVTSREVQRELK
jgi:hypothetical protein